MEVAGERARSPCKAALAEGAKWEPLVCRRVHSLSWEERLLLFQTQTLCGLRRARDGWKGYKGAEKRKLTAMLLQALITLVTDLAQ